MPETVLYKPSAVIYTLPALASLPIWSSCLFKQANCTAKHKEHLHNPVPFNSFDLAWAQAARPSLVPQPQPSIFSPSPHIHLCNQKQLAMSMHIAMLEILSGASPTVCMLGTVKTSGLHYMFPGLAQLHSLHTMVDTVW